MAARLVRGIESPRWRRLRAEWNVGGESARWAGVAEVPGGILPEKQNYNTT